jgi:hypothetical protein
METKLTDDLQLAIRDGTYRTDAYAVAEAILRRPAALHLLVGSAAPQVTVTAKLRSGISGPRGGSVTDRSAAA